MRRTKRLTGISLAVSIASLLLAAVPSSAAPVTFGANLTNQTQPTNSSTCHNEIGVPSGTICSWVGRQSFENGSHATAPLTGRLHKLKLVSCIGGSFTLQLVKLNASGRAKLDHTGPTIHYAADPNEVDNDQNTICGGDNSDAFIVQTFNINVAVTKGDYIAVKAAKVGPLHCSGDNTDIYSPALAPSSSFRTMSGSAGCDLLIRLVY